MSVQCWLTSPKIGNCWPIRLYLLHGTVSHCDQTKINKHILTCFRLYRCDDVIEYPAANVFAKAKDFKAISYPGAGHGLNFALNATGAYAEIFDFLEK